MDPVTVEPVPDGFTLPEETGKTFYENARLKAAAIRAQFLEQGGEAPWVMADDSGIEIAALGGAPGIYSSRYAGEDATDRDNVAKLLAELENKSDRSARFVCELVCLDPEGRELRGTGLFAGTIAQAPRGEWGFGYDPVFLPEGFELTVSQISAEEKNCISHRARAVRELLSHLGGGKGARQKEGG
jgi:XTP/dITP diphosphohydrolase